VFVEPLNETAGLSSVERVEDALLPVIQGIEEGVKTMQAGCFALLDPKLQSALDRGAIRNLVKNGAQQGTRHAGVGQSRDLLKQRDDFSWLIRTRQPTISSARWLSTRWESIPGKTGWSPATG